jgi:hypothetical protein
MSFRDDRKVERFTKDRIGAYSLLTVALRNALFRVSDSNTALCPSPIFRALEAGEIGVGEATDRLEVLLRMLASGVAQANHDYDGDRP